MTKFSNVNSPHLTLVEQASPPDTPAAGKQKLFIDSADSKLYLINEIAAVTEVGGGGAGSGITFIAEVAPSGVSTVTVATGIASTYNDLLITWVARGTNATDFVYMKFFLNNDTTAANYRYSMGYSHSAATLGAEGGDDATLAIISGNTSPSGASGCGRLDIPYYKETAFNKQMNTRGGFRREAGGVQVMNFFASAEWENAAAITRVDATLSAGNFAAGSKIRIYGVA